VGPRLDSRSTGERDRAQRQRRPSAPVEDYALVLCAPAAGILGTIEVGNTFPRAGTDGEWKIAWRDAILILRTARFA